MRDLAVVHGQSGVTSSTTELIIASIPSTPIVVGTFWRYEAHITKTTSATSATCTFNMRYGANKTTADTAMLGAAGAGITSAAFTTIGDDYNVRGVFFVQDASHVQITYNCIGNGTTAAVTKPIDAIVSVTLATTSFFSMSLKCSTTTGGFQTVHHYLEKIA